MLIQPLIQSVPFDVSDWEVDSEFGVFPQGARAKDALFAPNESPDSVIVAGKRYLFKRSKRSYPDQFWGEIIAYRIACLLGVQVPPAFTAYNSRTGYSAALIEWFYSDGKELFVTAGDFLQKIQPDFDRKYGAAHNMADNIRLMRTFTREKVLDSGWRKWWIEALVFDTLIGNTDRHQDNWGFVFFHLDKIFKCNLAPLFDNGTSLGHERFPGLVAGWRDADFTRYINKGQHHVKWALAENQPAIQGHFELLRKALEEWPETQDEVSAKLNFSQSELSDAVSDLCHYDVPVPLSTDRITLILSLLKRRHTLLKSLFL
jgi:HipA-like C-terminal domain